MHIPYANVIFDLDCDAALATVHGYLEDVGIAWCGRYGDWAYIWTDRVLHERRERGSEGARRAGPTRAMSAGPVAGYGTM